MARDGVRFCLGVNIKEIKTRGGDKVVVFEEGGREVETAVDEILLAVGWRPNIEGLDLEAAGIDYSRTGVTVNDRLQTSNGSRRYFSWRSHNQRCLFI